MARIYAIILGAVLAILGILGFTMTQSHDSASHSALHLVSGLVGLTLGFVSGGKYARGFAIGFGIVYTLVALIGFAGVPAFIVSSLNLNAIGHLIHLAVGLISFGVWFGARQKPVAAVL